MSYNSTEESTSKELLELIKNQPAEPVTPEKEKEETFGQSINFKHLFRVKGKKPLFFPIGHTSKSGLVPMYEFLGAPGGKTIWAHFSDVQSLDEFRFHLDDGQKIEITQVFDNLNNHYGENLEIKFSHELMQIMIPDYHQELFKPYNAEKILNWYLEIREKIKLNSAIPKETEKTSTHEK